MKKRTGIIVGIVAWSLVLVIFTGIFAACAALHQKGGFSSMFSWPFSSRSEYVTVKEETLTEEVNRIELSWISGRATLYKSEGPGVRVVQKAAEDFPEEDQMHVSVQNGALTVEDGRNRGWRIFSFGWRSGSDLEIYLPEKQYERIKGDFTSCDVLAEGFSAREAVLKTVSGDIRLSGDFETVNLSSTSGDIDLTGTRSEGDLKASSTSGDITAETCGAGGQLILSSTSGKITGAGAYAQTLKANTVSGKIALAGGFSSVDCRSTSGKVELETDAPLETANFETVSGGIELTMPENSGFTVTFEKVSGNLRSEFATVQNGQTYLYQDGRVPIRIHTVSGDARLIKAK